MGEVWNAAFPYVAALLPTIGVGFLFYHIMKYILEGDRRERLAQARWEREQGMTTEADSPIVGAAEPSLGDSPKVDEDSGQGSASP
jgi:hypothetical protein